MPVQNPAALLQRLVKEPNETPWLEFKLNNGDPHLIGKLISACANATVLAGKDRAYIVFGVHDKTHELVGSTVQLNSLKVQGENFINWITRKIQPQLLLDFQDFSYSGLNFSILVIEPTYDKPVKFDGIEYIRVGENIKELSRYPEHERAIWYATGRRKFESAVALTHQSEAQILEKLDVDIYYELIQKEAKPSQSAEIIRRFIQCGFILDDMEGGYDITNLGALLFAHNISHFPSIATKSIRVIHYTGTDKLQASNEQEGRYGYAVGFRGVITYVMQQLPKEEKYIDGVRVMDPVYPPTAIREVIANALIHQDFTISGAGPVIEIYSDRVEITNPGNSLIAVDRIFDERRSRNEKLASAMRDLHLCEERGGGLDKTLLAIEEKKLPAPAFSSSEHSMRVTLLGPKLFNELSKADKLRACFQHCVLRWMKRDFMSNSSLRERFSLPDEAYQAVSSIISEATKKNQIKPADVNQGNRFAKYVPPWAT